MLFQIYGDMAGWQLLGWGMVFVGLVVMNEIARRTKAGGIFCFFVLPDGGTDGIFHCNLYRAAKGADWALQNDTYVHMNSWFHYAKLYAATAGCIGFMMLKYKWGIGKKDWFKVFPFAIVAINILIAVGSDFESAIKGGISGGWWLSSENVWLYGGWWNWVNGIAGIINIFCMTGWWGIYSSKNKQDMLWPDMTWCYILAYDLWNFEYTYNNLPTHSWYCGLHFFLLLHLQMHFGIRAVGFKTELTHLHFGVCLLRYFRFSKTRAASRFLHPFMQTDIWTLQFRQQAQTLQCKV